MPADEVSGRGRPRVVLAPDKFKGCLTAAEVVDRLAAGVRSASPEADIVAAPVADGGDGTVAAALAAGYERVPVTAAGPTGRPVGTAYARHGDVAVVEMADVCGLGRLVEGRKEPLRASSRGVGQVVAAALDHGCTTVVLGIGGSASSDGGAGMVAALGARVLDADGVPVADGGAGLLDVARLDLTGRHPRLAAASVVVACDVENPLTGPTGAAAVYGPQKGAGEEDVALLERGLRRWATVVAEATHGDLSDHPGAGAAGGVGFAALALLGATLRPGIDLVLDLVGFAERVAGAHLVVTGEGSLDEQSLHGKAPVGVAAAAARAAVPVVAVCGRSTLTDAQLRSAGIEAAYALQDLEPDPERSIALAPALLECTGATIARILAVPARTAG